MTADRFCFDGRTPCELSALPTNAGDAREDKPKYLSRTAANLEEMGRLQDGFYADGREGLVVILQALDAAGKDSTVKHVMGGLNPQGVTVHSFKQPSAEELSHDFLWRANRALPPRGGIAIFNRSYYEDVLVVQVHACRRPTACRPAPPRWASGSFSTAGTARSGTTSGICTKTDTGC